jgi:hypothetical protein
MLSGEGRHAEAITICPGSHTGRVEVICVPLILQVTELHTRVNLVHSIQNRSVKGTQIESLRVKIVSLK